MGTAGAEPEWKNILDKMISLHYHTNVRNLPGGLLEFNGYFQKVTPKRMNPCNARTLT